MWFSRAECTFRLKNVVDEQDRFCHVVSALPRNAMRLVADLVEAVPEDEPYRRLKERLLVSHQLTDLQKVDLLIEMPALGDRKPTQLLAAMMEVCPRGQEQSVFLSALFLRKLPADVRILLAHMDHGQLNDLAAAADQLCTMRPSTAGTVAQLEQEPAEIAAVSGRDNRQAASKRQKPAGRQQGKQQGKKPEEPELSKAARLAAGVCLRHWRYGNKAFSCDGNCCWAGNE